MDTAPSPLTPCSGCTHPRRQHRPQCACGCTAMKTVHAAPRHARPKGEPKPACSACGRKRGHKRDCGARA